MKEQDFVLFKQLCQMVGYQHPESFLGMIDRWKLLLKTLRVNQEGKIVEFGSGISPKLLFALNSFEFNGVFTVVEIDDQALSAQRYVYSRMKPDFVLQTVKQDLFEFDTQGYDLIAGNHLLDDLIAADYANSRGINYSDIFPDPSLQQKFWEEVEKDETSTSYTLQRLSKKLSIVDTNSLVIFNNYSANFDFKYGLDKRQVLCDRLLLELGSLLREAHFIDIPAPTHSDDHIAWMIMKRAAHKKLINVLKFLGFALAILS